MKRVNNIKTKLKSHKIGSIFITSPYNISYLTNLFPSSIEEREYYLFVTANNAYVLAPMMFMFAIKEKLVGFEYLEITNNKSLYKLLEEICSKQNLKSIGFEEENLLYREFEHLSKNLKAIEFIPLEDFVEDEREIKDRPEIEKIREACRITDKCYSHILKNMRTNVTEKKIAWEIENYIRQNGGQIAFQTIVAFGKNGASPHHIPTSYKLEDNNFVLLDFGAKFEGYCADMSRTVYFGTPNDREVKMYNTVLESQNMALTKLKEWKDKNFYASHLHTISQSHIENSGFPSFPHSLGHGIGLQVHENPTVSKFSEKNILSKNMIITIEPAIYEPKIGGVRIEDDVLLTKDGYEMLTKSKRELTVIK